MGNDATNYLPKEGRRQKVESFLILLGYAKHGSWYTFFKKGRAREILAYSALK